MKEKFEQIAGSIKKKLAAAKVFIPKHPFKTVALVLAPLIGVAAFVKLLGLIVALMTATAEGIVAFLDRYLIWMIIIALVVWWLADKRSKRKEERTARKRWEQEQERAHCLREYETTKEATYTQEGKMVFSVVKDMASMGIVPPMRLSDIYSPSRTIPIEGGAAMLCQFLVQKTHDVDEDQFANIMQTKVDQRLSAGEWAGVKVQHIYNGRVYSGFVIHKVRDSPGGFLEVYTALVNDAYCRYTQGQELGNDAPPPSIDRRDMDY